MIERRPYFVLGDLVSCTAAGALAGLAAAGAVGSNWHVVVGMLLGMGVGMVVALVLGLTCFLLLFGALEVMLPTTLTGMVAGMVIGMCETMTEIGGAGSAGIGAIAGALVLLYTYGMNAYISGRSGPWTS